jgi:probable F420-dependent oxidoreductase
MYPQYEIGADPADLTRFAQAAETMGLDYLGYPDHVLAVSPEREPPMPALFTEHDRWQDPFCVFAYLAGKTRRIELVTSIMIIPQRQTALVARQAADVDLLTNGRLCVAMGLGWNYAEYEAVGMDYHTRGRRMDEQIPLLRRLWGEDIVTFEGRFDRLDRAGLNPRPRRQIPIWLGGLSEPAYRRGAGLGDGFVFACDFETGRRRAERVLAYLAEQGRAAQDFGFQLVPANLDRASRVGPGPIIDQLRRWRDWGGGRGTIVTTEQGLESVEQHIDFLQQVREGVLA